MDGTLVVFIMMKSMDPMDGILEKSKMTIGSLLVLVRNRGDMVVFSHTVIVSE